MKNLKTLPVIILFSSLWMSCEHPIKMKTVVYEDGSLEKVIELEKADSINIVSNYFNINESKGWTVSIDQTLDDSTSNKNELRIRFEKKFNSVDEVNLDLDLKDSLSKKSSHFSQTIWLSKSIFM